MAGRGHIRRRILNFVPMAGTFCKTWILIGSPVSRVDYICSKGQCQLSSMHLVTFERSKLIFKIGVSFQFPMTHGFPKSVDLVWQLRHWEATAGWRHQRQRRNSSGIFNSTLTSSGALIHQDNIGNPWTPSAHRICMYKESNLSEAFKEYKN